MFSLYSVGQKKSRKIPAKFPTKFPCEKSKKVHRRASAGAQGEKVSPVIARQLRDKNCLAATFVSRHQDVSQGPLTQNYYSRNIFQTKTNFENYEFHAYFRGKLVLSQRLEGAKSLEMFTKTFLWLLCGKLFTGGKSTRKNPPKIKKFIWTSLSEQFPLGSWPVWQGEGKSSRELFEKVRANAVFFLVFRDFGWVFGPLIMNVKRIIEFF